MTQKMRLSYVDHVDKSYDCFFCFAQKPVLERERKVNVCGSYKKCDMKSNENELSGDVLAKTLKHFIFTTYDSL